MPNSVSDFPPKTTSSTVRIKLCSPHFPPIFSFGASLLSSSPSLDVPCSPSLEAVRSPMPLFVHHLISIWPWFHHFLCFFFSSGLKFGFSFKLVKLHRPLLVSLPSTLPFLVCNWKFFFVISKDFMCIWNNMFVFVLIWLWTFRETNLKE